MLLNGKQVKCPVCSGSLYQPFTAICGERKDYEDRIVRCLQCGRDYRVEDIEEHTLEA